MWFVFALLSAIFAALTSILAKLGIEGVPSNLATAIRTTVVLLMRGRWSFSSTPRAAYRRSAKKLAVFDPVRPRDGRVLAVLLSHAADR